MFSRFSFLFLCAKRTEKQQTSNTSVTGTTTTTTFSTRLSTLNPTSVIFTTASRFSTLPMAFYICSFSLIARA